jgi:hypothetical protein
MNEHYEYECVDYEKQKKETIEFPNSEDLLRIASISIAIMLNERKKLQKNQEQEIEDEKKI